MAPYWGPVQTAPGFGFLENRNSITAGILYSKGLYSRRFFVWILYKRLQNGTSWNITIPPQQAFHIPRRIFQKIPCLDPVQTAPESGFLAYRNPTKQEVPLSRSLCSRSILTGILYKPLQDVEFWNVEISPGWKFYIPEAYIPEASLLESCTNGSRMGPHGI